MNHKPASRRQAPPLDTAALRAIALGYVGRYATSRAKLRAYLARKLSERGWAGDAPPSLDTLIADFATLGYVDDRAFAEARGAALVRRGYGARRVGQALHQAGIEVEDAAPAYEQAHAQAFEAAMRLAARRRIGPFASRAGTPQEIERAIAALIRGGHDFGLARRIATARPGEELVADPY